LMRHYLVARNPDDPIATNYALWQNRIFWTADDAVNPKFFCIEVALKAQATMVYKDGVSLRDKWTAYTDRQRLAMPTSLQEGFFFTDKYAFHYFIVQQKLTSECYSGIVLSLVLAYLVLLFATANVIVATCAILSITSIVASVMAFAVWNNWRLGMLEAIIFVMIIGMSVDYVVHMADAYLEAVHNTRDLRTRFMLGKMGISVVSGAITTLGASTFMCFATITFTSLG